MSGRWGRRRSVLTLPAVGAALTPKLICPACWPAYTAVLSAFGLGFVATAPYLFPLTILFLAMALASLGGRAWSASDPAPFAVGVGASVAIVAGKFSFNSKGATYAGVALLVVAWLSPRRAAPSCPSCAPGEKSVLQSEREGAS